MKHYGVSPWEINVITSILDKRFKTEDEEIENTYEDKFVSHLEIAFPYSFNEEFFKWFDFKEWDSCLLYTSPSPRDRTRSRMPSSA